MSKSPKVFEPNVRLYAPTESFHSHRIVWYDPPDSKLPQHRNTTSRKSPAEAERVARRVAKQLVLGHNVEKGDMLVSEIAKLWAAPDAHAWKPKYRDKVVGCYNRFLAQPLGNLRCRDLSPVVFRRVLIGMEKQGYSDSYRQDVGATMRNLVSFMQAEGHVHGDPMAGVSYSVTSSEAGESVHLVEPDEIPTWEQIQDVSIRLAFDSGQWWRALQPMVGAWSGLRLGEMLALRAWDVKLDENLIRVERAIVQPDSQPAYIDQPKHGKRRWTIFPGFLRDALERRMEEALSESSDAWMFPGPSGGWDTNFGQRRFRPAALAVGFELRSDGRLRHSFHSTRHFFCTNALLPRDDGGLGLPVAEVAMLAGHASADFTMRRYVAARQNALQSAAAVAAKLSQA